MKEPYSQYPALPTVAFLQGDVSTCLKQVPDTYAHCVVTSPPYWGLRDYGVDGQIGLEETPDQYVARMVEVFREVWRVLRDDGTCWVNLGDSYATTTKGGGGTKSKQPTNAGSFYDDASFDLASCGLKPKDLVGIPWRVAFALQADGWYLRSDIIWAKPNSMPESVTDRPTKAHEYLFLLTKQPRYYYDAEAVREVSAYPGDNRAEGKDTRKEVDPMCADGGSRARTGNPRGTHRNRRTVWTMTREDWLAHYAEMYDLAQQYGDVFKVATQPFRGAHFATFPQKLVEPCILAGCPDKCCPECGAPWVRETKVEYANPGNRTTNGPRSTENRDVTAGFAQRLERHIETVGFHPSCSCGLDPAPGVVLDPFGGSGTVNQVARSLGRSSIYIDLSSSYLDLARKRYLLPTRSEKMLDKRAKM